MFTPFRLLYSSLCLAVSIILFTHLFLSFLLSFFLPFFLSLSFFLTLSFFHSPRHCSPFFSPHCILNRPIIHSNYLHFAFLYYMSFLPLFKIFLVSCFFFFTVFLLFPFLPSLALLYLSNSISISTMQALPEDYSQSLRLTIMADPV